MKAKPWTFAEWFEAQHGKRPGRIDIGLLRDRIQSQEIMLIRDKELLQRLELWDQQRTSALYAWQIKDGDKG